MSFQVVKKTARNLSHETCHVAPWRFFFSAEENDKQQANGGVVFLIISPFSFLQLSPIIFYKLRNVDVIFSIPTPLRFCFYYGMGLGRQNLVSWEINKKDLSNLSIRNGKLNDSKYHFDFVLRASISFAKKTYCKLY